MVYAIYNLKDNQVIKSVDSDSIIKEIVTAFAHNKVEFIRWAFDASPIDTQRPELTNVDAQCLIRLEREDDRVTVFATDHEIQTMFAVLLNEAKPFQMVTGFTDIYPQTIDVTFHPFVRD